MPFFGRISGFMHKTSLRIACLLTLLFPTLTFAGTVHVEDTIAGLGTDIEIEHLSGNEKGIATVLPPFGPEKEIHFQADAEGKAIVRLHGEDTEEAGTYTVLLEDSSESTVQFTVLPDSIDTTNSSIQSAEASLRANDTDTVTVSVIIRDRFSNPLSGRPVSLISSRTSDAIASITSETDNQGEQMFSISTREPGTITLRAIDLLSGKTLAAQSNLVAEIEGGNYVGGYTAPSRYNDRDYTQTAYGKPLFGSAQNPYRAQLTQFDVLAGFEINAPRELQTNEDASITIRAVDHNGQTVEDYVGTVILRSTDPAAFLPLSGEILFLPQNLGEKRLTLGLRFRTSGEHILHAEDSTNPTLSGEAMIMVGGSNGQPAEKLITVTSHSDGSSVSTFDITLEGEGPPFINLLVTGGTQDTRGESLQDGTFSIPVQLNQGQVDHTLRLRDDTGRYDSGDIHLKLDTVAPVIGTITFTPVEPIEEESMTISVESDEELDEIRVMLADKEIPLSVGSAGSGSYQGTLEAPDAGTYQPAIIAVDKAGNETEVRTTMTVKQAPLPTVQNIHALPQSNSVTLTWDEITTEPVSGYRIYVGESEDDFLHTLETNPSATSATVAGLTPGITYYFAVTAFQGGRESEKPSEIISVTVLGIQLNITPQDGALLLEWTSLGNDIPLSAFQLEYGVEKDQYMEKRILNGEMENVVLRDLLNDVTYFVRLTPITTTGDILEELATVGEGTPSTDQPGFHASPSDPIPYVPGSVIDTSPPNVHQGAPITAMTGIPLSMKWMVTLIGIFVIGYAIHFRRKREAMSSFLRTMEHRYHQE
jgi:hypothetical protein